MRRLSGSTRVVLAASLVLLLGAALFPRVGADESDAVSAATATVTFVGGERTVPVVVDAWVDPAEVPDGGSVNVAWALTLPSADELLVADGLTVTFPLPATAIVAEVDVAAIAGVDRTGWTVANGHLTVDLGLAGGADPVRVTVTAAVGLPGGIAPTVVPFGAPDALVLAGVGPGGGDLTCSPTAPVPALVEVVVSQVTVPTSAPTTSVPTTSPPPSGTPPSPTTTPRDPAAAGDAPTATPPDPSEVPAVPPGPAPPSRVVTGDASGAEARLTAVQDRLADSSAELAELRRRAAGVERGLRRLEVERRQMADKLLRRSRDLDALLAATYIAAVDAEVTPEVPDTGSVPLATALDHARREYERLLGREAEVMAQLGDIATQRAESRRSLDRARADHRDLQAAVTDGRRQLETFRLGGGLAVTGFHFPVDRPYDFSDTWHAPRSGGRQHEGTDVFAAEGTPLRAVERGVLADVGTGTLGGIKLWLVGESGTHYYYAHLSGYAPGVADDVVVDAGEVIGYVGHTGNARTTPPHLHFEVHPAGGDAVDGYPLLAAAYGARAASVDPGATGSTASVASPATPSTTTTTVPSTPPTATAPAPGGGDANHADGADDAPAVGGAAPVSWSAWGADGRARAGARPVAVAVGSDGRAYAADVAGDRIVVLAADGSRLGAFGGPGSAEGRFHEPRALAVAPDGTLYVADTGNNRIQHFSAEGDLLGAWGRTGSREARFNEPTGVAVDGRGRVFVVDRLNNRVQVFDGDGRLLRSWGGFGAEPGRFANPTGVAVGPDGDVYVADTFNARVQRFTARGTYVGEWAGRLRRPVGVVVTAAGELVVADDSARPVRQLDAAGHQIVAWGGAEVAEGPEQVRGVALDGAGRLYLVADGAVLAYRGAGGAATP